MLRPPYSKPASLWCLVAALSASSWAGESKGFVWPNPGAVQEADVPGISWAQGIPMKLHVIQVRRPADELVDFYGKAFSEAHLYIPPAKHQPQVMRELVLTALDPDRLMTYTVIFQPVSANTTNLVLGESNLALRKKDGDDPPLFPGAKDILRSRQEGTRVVAYRADAKAAAVRSFYQDVFSQAGFFEKDPVASPGVFSREAEEVNLTIHEKPAQPLTVTLMFHGSPVSP